VALRPVRRGHKPLGTEKPYGESTRHDSNHNNSLLHALAVLVEAEPTSPIVNIPVQRGWTQLLPNSSLVLQKYLVPFRHCLKSLLYLILTQRPELRVRPFLAVSPGTTNNANLQFALLEINAQDSA
jgi:hypothetical protein